MDLVNFFKPVPKLSPDRIRDFLKEKNHGTYNLIDVRQPGEYEQGHLPGAQLIPIGQLPSRMRELDPEKPTITYWRSGIRSRAAAEMLLNAGFREVYSMDGGISAWHGLTAAGAPDAGMAFFAKAHRPEELIALSWILEEGSRTFYAGMEIRVQEQKAKSLYHDLTIAEEHHKSALSGLYKKLTLRETETDFPWSVIPDKPDASIMEGGMKVQEALEWAQGKGLVDVLELSISLETNAYDLYLKMSREFADPQSKEVFDSLSNEEKHHLDRLTSLLDSML